MNSAVVDGQSFNGVGGAEAISYLVCQVVHGLWAFACALGAAFLGAALLGGLLKMTIVRRL